MIAEFRDHADFLIIYIEEAHASDGWKFANNFDINNHRTIQDRLHIRKTCPCIEYPLKPHFYTVKLGYEGVYLFFLFLLQNIDCGYSLEPPRRGGSNLYPQSMF